MGEKISRKTIVIGQEKNKSEGLKKGKGRAC